MAVIKVKKTPASAYNPKRPVSTLLRTQIKALQIAVADAIDSEGEAAEYIRELTGQLKKYHPHTSPRAHSENTKSAENTKRAKTKGRNTTSMPRGGKRR